MKVYSLQSKTVFEDIWDEFILQRLILWWEIESWFL